MLLLLNSTKTQDFEHPIVSRNSTKARFLGEVNTLVSYLQTYSEESLQTLMKISPKIAKEVYKQYLQFEDSPPQIPTANQRQAIFSYTGAVFLGLNPASFSEEELLFAQKYMHIISGLYGLLKPLDLIQPYRLDMNTPLITNKGNNLYAFWDKDLTAAVNSADADLIINLTSLEFSKVLQKKLLRVSLITPVFKEKAADGSVKTIPMHTKTARGLFARYAVKHMITIPKDLQNFNLAHYVFSEEHSSEEEWIFIRPEQKLLL